MKPEDKKHFAVLMKTLSETFEKPIAPQQMAIYFEAMESFTIEQVTYGVKEAIKACQYLPRPAHIIEFAKQAPRRPLPPSNQLTYTPEQHEDAAARFAELSSMFDKWGNA